MSIGCALRLFRIVCGVLFQIKRGESISGHCVLFPLDPEMFDVIILLWQKRRHEPTLFSVLVRDWWPYNWQIKGRE